MTDATELGTGTHELLCEIRNRVATVTLNRPHKKNSLSDQLTPALREILLVLEERSDVGCVMLTGTGDAFCSGGNVSGFSGGASDASDVSRPPPRGHDERVAELIRKQEALTLRLYELAKPTVAALPGPAAGAGLSIALACDLRVASRNAFITTAFRNIGLSGDYGSSWFLNRLIGQSKAKELMYFSERVSAEECAELGLVNSVFETETFREDAFAYAERLANGPTVALSRMKRNINRGGLQGLRESLALEAEHMVASFQTEDAREAIRAFAEKRQPDFKFR
jgi:enoyl-CoA hydratase/carnithine racemase